MENIIRDKKRHRRTNQQNQHTMKKRQLPDDHVVAQRSPIHGDAVSSSSHHSSSTVHPSTSASASSHHSSASSSITVLTRISASTTSSQTATQTFSFVPFANSPSAGAASTDTPISNSSRATTTASSMSFGTIFGSIAGVIIVAVIVGLVYRSQRRKANSREGPAGTVRYRPSQNGGARRTIEKPLDASYPYFKGDASMPTSEATSSYPFFKSPEPITPGSPHSQMLSETSRGGESGAYLEMEIDEPDEGQYQSSPQSLPRYPAAPEPSYPGMGERQKSAANY